MDKKYEYLKNYLLSNYQKSLDDCSIFDVDKFSLEQNVDYIYLFIAHDSPIPPIDDIIDPEKKYAVTYSSNEQLYMHDYTDEPTDYPVRTNKYIPVVSNSELSNKKIILRNIDNFYALGLMQIPVNYWKPNPAFGNYATLLRNTIKQASSFSNIINFYDTLNFEYIFKNSTTYSTNVPNFEPTVLINTHTGLANYADSTYTTISWVDLDIPAQTTTALEYNSSSSDIRYIPAASSQKNNIYSGISIQKIINAQKENGLYLNSYARTAHTIYNPYIYDLNNIDWYSWINFINNQYDNGIIVTEYNVNLESAYKMYKEMYISTFQYPATLLDKKMEYINVPKIIREDPKWSTLDVSAKIKYLNDDCTLIKFNWYTKNTYLYVCCDHTKCLLKKEPYPTGLIVRLNGQEICKNCGEIIGNYNDEQAFVDGMDTIEPATTIKYTWYNNQKEETAKESWTKLSPIVEAVDSSFITNPQYVSAFIAQYHSSQMKKLRKTYDSSPFAPPKENRKNNPTSQDSLYKQFEQDIYTAISTILSNKITETDQILNYFTAVVFKYINNDDIVSYLREYATANNLDIEQIIANINKEKQLDHLLNTASDPTIQYFIRIAISNIQCVKYISRTITLWYRRSYYNLRNYYSKHRKLESQNIDVRELDVSQILNFLKNIFRKSRRFFKIIFVAFLMAKVKCEATQEKTYEYNFNDINWSILWNTEYNGVIQDKAKEEVMLNVYSFEQFQAGRFLNIYIATNTIDEYVTNMSAVDWINKMIKTFITDLKLDINVSILMTDRMLNYGATNNDMLKYQESLIQECYKMFKERNLPLLNNANGVIINKVIDSITCPDIVTRKFDQSKDFKQLLHADFPTADEYFRNRYESNIVRDYFNEDQKIIHFYYMDIIKWIDSTFIRPLYDILFNNQAPNETVEQSPDLEQMYQALLAFKSTVMVKTSDYNDFLNNLFIPNTGCKQTLAKIRNLMEATITGIDTVEEHGQLTLVSDSNNITPNYTQAYYALTPEKRLDRNLNTIMKVCDKLIRWYMLCVDIEKCNHYTILKTSIDNFHTYLFVNKVYGYTLLKNPVNNYNELINKFISEFFVYNNVDIKLLQTFFDDLKIQTHLFISPDIYIDTHVRTKRIITRINNKQTENSEIELRDLDTDEQHNENTNNSNTSNNNPGGFRLPYVNEVEVLDQNELIGGEVETDLIIDEDMQ